MSNVVRVASFAGTESERVAHLGSLTLLNFRVEASTCRFGVETGKFCDTDKHLNLRLLHPMSALGPLGGRVVSCVVRHTPRMIARTNRRRVIARRWHAGIMANPHYGSGPLSPSASNCA